MVPESTPPHVAKYKDRNELLKIKLMKKVYAGEHFHKYELYHKRFFSTVLEDSQKKKICRAQKVTYFKVYNLRQLNSQFLVRLRNNRRKPSILFIAVQKQTFADVLQNRCS